MLGEDEDEFVRSQEFVENRGKLESSFFSRARTETLSNTSVKHKASITGTSSQNVRMLPCTTPGHAP